MRTVKCVVETTTWSVLQAEASEKIMNWDTFGQQ